MAKTFYAPKIDSNYQMFKNIKYSNQSTTQLTQFYKPSIST